MQLSPTVIAALVAALVVVVVVVLLRQRGPRRTHTSSYRGPDNLHFVCAGCKGQFTHTKRTVAAWERGSRRLFCNSCHRSWREGNPGASRDGAQAPRQAARSASPRRLAPTRSGCLSVVVVAAVLPLLLYAAARYA
jgi:hypothetical protein